MIQSDLFGRTSETILNESGHDFDGLTYEKPVDGPRLSGQLLDVYEVLKDTQWWTIPMIQRVVLKHNKHHSEAGISARIRDLRKEKFGGFDIHKRRVREFAGLWEYRLQEEDA